MSGSGSREGFGSPPWDPGRPGARTGRHPGDPRPWLRRPGEPDGQGARPATGRRRSLGTARRRADGSADRRTAARATARPGTAQLRRKRPQAPAQPPQLLARASGARRDRGGARADHQVLRDPGLLHPVRLDAEHPRHRRPGADQQDRLPLPRHPPRRHHRVRRHRIVGLPTRRPARTSSAGRSASSRASSASATTRHIYIKRVIGLPGDHVACCNASGQITVNGVPLSEQSYLYPGNQPSAQLFNITVPPGRLWVMGDHRAVSYDSRGHMGDPGGGTIPESGVLGRAFVIIWPPSQVGLPEHPRDLRAAPAQLPRRPAARTPRWPPRWTTGRRFARPDRSLRRCRWRSVSPAPSR